MGVIFTAKKKTKKRRTQSGKIPVAIPVLTKKKGRGRVATLKGIMVGNAIHRVARGVPITEFMNPLDGYTQRNGYFDAIEPIVHYNDYGEPTELSVRLLQANFEKIWDSKPEVFWIPIVMSLIGPAGNKIMRRVLGPEIMNYIQFA